MALGASLSKYWQRWGGLLLSVLFVAAFFWLTSRQYATFQMRAPDVNRFDQAVWNTLNGRFLYSTLQERSILAHHFSPILALLAPLLLIWDDVRILFLVQTTGIAVAGYLLHKIVRQKYPALAPWFLLAFFLNPALHEIALLELRRIILAMPYLAFAFYALSKKAYWQMSLGLFLALLCKENIGLIVAMIGAYLFLWEREQKWGIALFAVGIGWLLAMLLWVIPSIASLYVTTTSDYPQLNYFAAWGNSLPEIILNIMRQPLVVLQKMFDAEGLLALWRIFLPLGILLPLLAPELALIALPSLTYMLLSNTAAMHRLEDWYMASVLPILFAAIGVGLGKRPPKQAFWLLGWLLATTAMGFLLFSQAPFGGQFERHRYQLTPHHQLAAAAVATVPLKAVVAAQSPYLVHLTHREFIYRYPWIGSQAAPIDFYLLDRRFDPYPLTEAELNAGIDNLVADPANVVVLEGDGIYLIQREGEQQTAVSVNAIAENSIRLDRAEVAVANQDNFFTTVSEQETAVLPNQQLRVTLYWEAIAKPVGERTVSVRLTASDGRLLAQHDMQPSHGARPTSWWEPGWQFRDSYYLTIPADTSPTAATVDLLLYDSFTQERIPFAPNRDQITLFNLTIAP